MSRDSAAHVFSTIQHISLEFHTKRITFFIIIITPHWKLHQLCMYMMHHRTMSHGSLKKYLFIYLTSTFNSEEISNSLIWPIRQWSRTLSLWFKLLPWFARCTILSASELPVSSSWSDNCSKWHQYNKTIENWKNSIFAFTSRQTISTASIKHIVLLEFYFRR